MNIYGIGGSEVHSRFKRQFPSHSLPRPCFSLGFLIACALAAQQMAVGQQNLFQGSVPTDPASPTPLALTLRSAIDRGLKTNLGLLVSDSASETARGQRLEALSALLPKLNARVTQTEEQISLKTLGFNLKIPGVSIPDDYRPVPLHRRARLCVLDRIRLQCAQEPTGRLRRTAAPRSFR